MFFLYFLKVNVGEYTLNIPYMDPMGLGWEVLGVTDAMLRWKITNSSGRLCTRWAPEPIVINGLGTPRSRVITPVKPIYRATYI